MDSSITHEGVVSSAGKESVTVLLSAGISCAGCQAERSCNLSGSSRKMIKIDGSFDINPGDKVIVSMKRSQGFSALLLGYIFPLAVLVLSLAITFSVTGNELLSAAVSFGLLIPYYMLLYLFRKTISSRYTFNLNRIN